MSTSCLDVNRTYTCQIVTLIKLTRNIIWLLHLCLTIPEPKLDKECAKLIMMPFTVTTVSAHLEVPHQRVQLWGQTRRCRGVNYRMQRGGKKLPQPLYGQKRCNLPRMRGDTALRCTDRKTNNALLCLQYAVNNISSFWLPLPLNPLGYFLPCRNSMLMQVDADIVNLKCIIMYLLFGDVRTLCKNIFYIYDFVKLNLWLNFLELYALLWLIHQFYSTTVSF